MSANTPVSAFSSMIYIEGFGSVLSTTILLENGTVVAYVPTANTNNKTVYAWRRLPEVPQNISQIPLL